MQKLRIPELLAPAGNLEKLKFAFHYGADSVYLGGKIFSLRAQAENFSMSDLKQAKRIADELHKTIYLALNIFFRNQDFKSLGKYLQQILKIGIKHIIISDIGVLRFINKHFRNLFHISISTQANMTNYEAINFLQELGAQRIILARELDLTEIKEIRKRTKVELETFIHGAMCVSYSGRCLLSEYLTQRNANRGDCTQPCRWEYTLIEKTRPDEKFTMEEDQKGTRILSSKDLMTLNILNKLIRAKIDSFKIEGRMKSIYYVANVTRVYRKAMDLILQHKKINLTLLMKELDSFSHRPYFNGFFIKNRSTIAHHKDYVRNYKFIGYIKKRVKDNLYELVLKDTLNQNDLIEIINPDFKDLKNIRFKLYDKHFRPVERGVITDKFYLETENELSEYSIMRR